MSDQPSADLDLGAAHLRPAQRRPAEPEDHQSPPPTQRLAWEGSRPRGRAAALVASWWAIVRSPAVVWSTVPSAGGARRPWTFALLSGGIFGVISELVDSATVALIRYGGGSGVGEIFQLDIAGRSLEWLPISVLSAAGCLVALVVGVPLYLLVYSLLVIAWVTIVHTLLRLGGGLSASPAGLEGTLRAVCYSQVAVVAAIVPWIGDPSAVLWSFALQVPALARMHRCSHGRALLAVGVPAGLLIVALVLLILFGDPQTISELPTG